MKSFLFCILFIYSFAINGQNNQIYGYVEYLTEIQLGLPVFAISHLHFNSYKSNFIEGKFSEPDVASNINSRLEYPETIINNQIQFFTNVRERKIFKYHPVQGENFLVEEELFPIRWKISNEIKTILGYNCQKATGEFRGRNYIVWFTSDIPVPLGPWKLNGLPGLIIQAEDLKNKINFTARRISFSNSKTEDGNLVIEKLTNTRKIPIKEYIEIIEKKEREEVSRIIATLPRNSIVKDIKFTGREMKLELIYEWE